MKKPAVREEGTPNRRHVRARAGRRSVVDGRTSRAMPCSREGTLRIVVVDDHAIVRRVIVRMLCEQPGFHVVGEASDGSEAVEMARRLEPDVVVIDFAMPNMDGAEATRQIKRHRRQTKVIGLSMFDESAVGARMLEAGADAFLQKSKGNEQLIAAIADRNA